MTKLATLPAGVRNIVLLWLAWVLIVIGFQALATARFQPQWPDHAQQWTQDFTKPETYQKDHPYLLEPFMNNQVAWDSEYYLGTAIGGYEDPCIPAIPASGAAIIPCTDTTASTLPGAGNSTKPMPLSYAFFPFYSFLIRLFAIPLSVLGMNAIATATLAGVIVSALGTLAGMLALYDLTYEALGEDGGLRAAFYLIVFPTGFFLVQIYTEGLFVGLAFACLAMLKRKRLVLAALLGAAATLTRAVGIALIIPMAVAWIRTNEWYALDLEWRQIYFKKIPLKPLWHALLIFSPLIAFLLWKFSYLGFAFDFVEERQFGRVYMDFQYAFFTWATSFREMTLGFLNMQAPRAEQLFINPQHSAYYFTEFLGMSVALVAILRCLKTDPEVAWFSLAVFLISLGSGPAQSMHRYVLAAPAVFITLSHWGKHPVFDRVWTLISILLMGLLAMLYAFNFWVA
jgi:hypothetical protein